MKSCINELNLGGLEQSYKIIDTWNFGLSGKTVSHKMQTLASKQRRELDRVGWGIIEAELRNGHPVRPIILSLANKMTQIRLHTLIGPPSLTVSLRMIIS